MEARWEGGGGGGESSGGGGRGSDEGGGGDACLVLCLSLPVPWWNAQSHERGPLSLSFSLRLVSCVGLKSATVPLLTHYLSTDLPSASKAHTATTARENARTQSHAHTGTGTHIQMCPSHGLVSLEQEK